MIAQDLCRLSAFQRLIAIAGMLALLHCAEGCYRRPSSTDMLIAAARRGDSRYVRAILRKEPSLVHVRLRGGATLLHWSAYEWDDAVTRALIDAGADLDARDSDGVTPLMTAVIKGRRSTVALLLRRGASPNIGDSRGAHPLWLAVVTPADLGIVKLLVDYGADVNTPYKGMKPVDVAAEQKIAAYLRAHGAR